MRGILLTVVLLLAVDAHADGKYYGDRSVTQPDMPRQRALVTYKDGVETLIVESVVDSEVAELAWVVPVPSEPTEIGFATEGTVATLPTLLEPDVWTVSPFGTNLWGVLALCALVYCFYTVGVRKLTGGRFLFEYFLVLFVALVPCAVMFPVFASAGSTSVAAGEWRSTDGMEAAVVGGGTTVGVVKWLKDSGFETSVEDASVIDAYVADGWSFVVSRVKAGKGQAAPKPLRVVFRTEEPVYPMRLTGVGLDAIHVDLCVIAGEPMRAMGLVPFETVKWDADAPQTRHPGIAAHVWDGACMSRLVGSLDGGALREDLSLNAGGLLGKKKLAAEGAIATVVLNVIMWGILLCQAVFGAVAIKSGWDRQRFLKFGVGLPLVVGTLVGLVTSLFVPTVQTGRDTSHRLVSSAKYVEMIAAEWAADIEHEEAYKDWVVKGVQDGKRYWGKDVPGGVVKSGEFVVSYDHHGNPTYHKIATSREKSED